MTNTTTDNRPQRQCIKCHKCEYRGHDPRKWNFNPFNYDKPKAFVNLFCSECLLSDTRDALYKNYARNYYARKYGNKYAPDKSVGNINSPYRRKSKHPQA